MSASGNFIDPVPSVIERAKVIDVDIFFCELGKSRSGAMIGLTPYRSGSWLGQEQGALFTALMQSCIRLRLGMGELVLGIRN